MLHFLWDNMWRTVTDATLQLGTCMVQCFYFLGIREYLIFDILIVCVRVALPSCALINCTRKHGPAFQLWEDYFGSVAIVLCNIRSSHGESGLCSLVLDNFFWSLFAHNWLFLGFNCFNGFSTKIKQSLQNKKLEILGKKTAFQQKQRLGYFKKTF